MDVLNSIVSISKKKWYLIILSILVFCMLFTMLAYSKYAENKESIDNYNKKLELHAEEIAIKQEAVDTYQQSAEEYAKTVDNYQEYLKHSIMMKIDPSSTYVAVVNFSVTDTENVGVIETAMMEYLKNPEVINELAEVMGLQLSEYIAPDQESVIGGAEYLRELISATANSNVVTIQLLYPDEKGAQLFADSVDKVLRKKKSHVEGVYGSFTWKFIDQAVTCQNMESVLVYQDTKQNELSGYLTQLANLQMQVSNQQTALDTFVTDNQPEKPDNIHFLNVVGKYIVFGFASGLIFYLVCAFLFVQSNDVIRREDDLSLLGLSCFPESSEETIKELKKRIGCEKLCILTENDMDRVCVDDDILYTTNSNEQMVYHMLSCGYVLLGVRIGTTTKNRIKNQLDLCKRLNVAVVGCVRMD